MVVILNGRDQYKNMAFQKMCCELNFQPVNQLQEILVQLTTKAIKASLRAKMNILNTESHSSYIYTFSYSYLYQGGLLILQSGGLNLLRGVGAQLTT